ncbi:MAG: hypothetical protein GY861_19190 [bacterium]|nr:hypothetical protein [bacterium]
METVGDLRKALEGVPDETELVVGVEGNQHYVYNCGLAKERPDGIVEMLEEDEALDEDEETYFYIDG